MEVLFVYEPHDELVFLALPQFQMKTTLSVEKWMQAIGDQKGDDSIIGPIILSYCDWWSETRHASLFLLLYLHS